MTDEEAGKIAAALACACEHCKPRLCQWMSAMFPTRTWYAGEDEYGPHIATKALEPEDPR